MLSAIEHKFVENIVLCNNKPIFAIYSTHVDHVKRAAGLASWDSHGPRYVLTKCGQIEFTGNFDDTEDNLLSINLDKSHSSNLLKFFNQENIDQYIGIVTTSKRKLENLYPGIEYYVFLWDDNVLKKYNKKLFECLKSKGIIVYLISEILPDYHKDKNKYIISLHDEHPNPIAYEIIAEFVVNNVLEN